MITLGLKRRSLNKLNQYFRGKDRSLKQTDKYNIDVPDFLTKVSDICKYLVLHQTKKVKNRNPKVDWFIPLIYQESFYIDKTYLLRQRNCENFLKEIFNFFIFIYKNPSFKSCSKSSKIDKKNLFLSTKIYRLPKVLIILNIRKKT